jgi:hypothetical protein
VTANLRQTLLNVCFISTESRKGLHFFLLIRLLANTADSSFLGNIVGWATVRAREGKGLLIEEEGKCDEREEK